MFVCLFDGTFLIWQGLVVFYAAAGAAASGLYAQPSSGAELSALVTMGDTLGGEAISFIGCEWQTWYECFAKAECGNFDDSDNGCAWKMTPELQMCLTDNGPPVMP